MKKYLIVKMPNNKNYKIPADIIATDRANYFKENRELLSPELKKLSCPAIFAEIYRNTIETDILLLEWASNTISWNEVKSVAKQIKSNTDEENWKAGKKEIIEENED